MTAAPAKKAAKKPSRRGRKLGWKGYADILRAIQIKPQSAQQLAERFDVQLQTMRRVLARFHDLSMLRVTEWRQLVERGSSVPVYAYGQGADAPRPATQPSRRPERLCRAAALPELVQVVHMLRRLEQEPISKVLLAEEIGSQQACVCRFVNHCHRIGLVRIADWSLRLRGGRPGALYGLGTGADAPRPARVPRSVIQRRNRAARRERQSTLHMIGLTARPLAGQQAQGASA